MQQAVTLGSWFVTIIVSTLFAYACGSATDTNKPQTAASAPVEEPGAPGFGPWLFDMTREQVLRGGLDDSRRFLAALNLIACAESLGGVESLIEHPPIMTHASVPPDRRRVLGIDDGFIRLSVGVEDVDDLRADLDRGFAAVV